MLVIKNCSTYGDNTVVETLEELREWHKDENYPFIRVIDTDKHLTLIDKLVLYKKDFMRVRVPFSTDPSGYITIPTEHLFVNGEKFTINQFFKEFQFKNEEEVK